jgi:hypothetical protein
VAKEAPELCTAARCPICGEFPSRAVTAGSMACVIEGGDRCVRRWFERLERLVKAKDAELAAKNARLLELEGRINTPHTDDWFDAVRLEAAHQVERFGTQHDAGKNPQDWFWLLGYLGGKALASAIVGDDEKAKHHTISSGAALLNWFRQLTGDSNRMRPGIADPEANRG